MLLYKKHKYELFKYVRKCFKKYLGEKYNDKEKWTTYSSHSYDSSINGTKCITNFFIRKLKGHRNCNK